MPLANVKEVALKSGRKAWFRRVTGKGRADLRSGPFLLILAQQQQQDSAANAESMYSASNEVERLQAGVMASHLCNAEGREIYASADDYLADIDVEDHRDYWRAFMDYVFGGDGKSGN